MLFFLFLDQSFAVTSSNYIQKITISKQKTGFNINFESKQIPAYKIFTLENPHRLVIDFDNSILKAKANITPFPAFKSFRSGVRENNGLRVVFNLQNEVKIAKSSILNKGSDSSNYRLIIELADAKFLKEKQKEKIKKTEIADKKYILTPLNSSIADQIINENTNNKNISGEVKNLTKNSLGTIKTKDNSIKSNIKPEERINAAKGLKKSKKIIVIDAGHGGKDPGAIGFANSREKNITLAFAKEIKKYLDQNEKFTVFLTRRSDYFIPLDKRVKISRDLKADLFISIHADSAESSDAKGLSIYTLSETSSDKQAEILANKENKADIIGGINFANTSGDILKTLIDLSQRSTMNESADFANFTIKHLQSNNINVKQNTHRFAGFRVLTSPEVPSVLIELGYLSNKEDEKNLNDIYYRKKFAKVIDEIIQRYFGVYELEE